MSELRTELQAELQRLCRENGDAHLTAEQVYEAAMSPDSPLHPVFEWDQQKTLRDRGLRRAAELLSKWEDHRTNEQDRRLCGLAVGAWRLDLDEGELALIHDDNGQFTTYAVNSASLACKARDLAELARQVTAAGF